MNSVKNTFSWMLGGRSEIARNPTVEVKNLPDYRLEVFLNDRGMTSEKERRQVVQAISAHPFPDNLRQTLSAVQNMKRASEVGVAICAASKTVQSLIVALKGMGIAFGVSADIINYYLQAEENRIVRSLSDLHLVDISTREGLSNESVRIVIAIKEVVQRALNEEAEIRLAAAVDSSRQRYMDVMLPFVKSLACHSSPTSFGQQRVEYQLVEQDLRHQINAMDQEIQKLREVYAHHKVRLLTTFSAESNDSNYHLQLGSFAAIDGITTIIGIFLINNVNLRIRYQLATDGLSELRSVREEIRGKVEEIDGLWQKYRAFRLAKITYEAYYSKSKICFCAFLTDTGSPQDPFAPQSIRKAYESTGHTGYQAHGPQPEASPNASPFFKLKFYEDQPHVFGWCFTHDNRAYIASKHFYRWYLDKWIIPMLSAAAPGLASQGSPSSRQCIRTILEKLNNLIEQYEDIRTYTNEVVRQMGESERQETRTI